MHAVHGIICPTSAPWAAVSAGVPRFASRPKYNTMLPDLRPSRPPDHANLMTADSMVMHAVHGIICPTSRLERL